jgi:hypothetical protein
LTVIVAGSLAQRPGAGGHAWVFLQYLLGFQDLGHEVMFLDRLEPEMCQDERGRPCDPEHSVNVRYLDEVMQGFGLGERYAVLVDGGARSIGVQLADALARVEASDLLLNVNGFVGDPEVLGRARLKVFLDIDPGFMQMWRALGLHDAFVGHDAYVTIGENVGSEDCTIPTSGIDWITTAQPVALELWPEQEPGGDRFTSVATWRGPFAPIEYEGVTYGLRAHEYRRFASIPTRSAETFEVALDIDPADEKDMTLLRECGWRLADPRRVAHDPWSYQAYLQGSRAEFMVAKGLYVQSRSGWLSDRSLCYLASGKPVLAQETGFSRRYPTGAGLVAFSTLEEALAGVSRIAGEYEHHCRAARRLAEEHFGSREVLGRLLHGLGVA